MGTYRWEARRTLVSAKNKGQEMMFSAELCEYWPLGL
jgi:hypothetical protein